MLPASRRRLLYLVLLPSPLLSGEVVLSELLAELRTRNPSIEAARQTHAARRQRRPQVTSLPDPKLQLSAQLESVETRVGPQRGGLGISQTFPTGGKLKIRGSLADRQVETAAEHLRGTILAAEAELKKVYYDYWFTRRSREITQEMMDLLRSGERVARTRYAAGRGPQEVVLKAQVELGVLEDRLRTLAELEPTLIDELLSLLDRPPGSSLGEPSAADLAERELVPSLETLYEKASLLSPTVRGLEIQATQKALEARLARKARVPDITFGLSWIPTGSALNPATPGNGDDPLIATFAVNLPLRRRRYQAAERERTLEREAILRARDDEVNALEAALKKAYFAYTDGRRKLSLYRDSLVPKGRQSLEATFASFQAGRASFLDLLDAERVLLDFELSHARGVADHLKAIATIERLVAEPVSQEVSP